MKTTLPIMLRSDSWNSTSELAMENVPSRRSGKKKFNPNSLDFTILGMCADASLSGVGCVLVRYQQESPGEQLHMDCIRYEEMAVHPKTRSSILNLLRGYPTGPYDLLGLQRETGNMFSTAIKRFCNNHRVAMQSIDLVGTQAAPIPPLLRPMFAGTPSKLENNAKLQSWTGILAEDINIPTATSLPMNRGSSLQREPSPQAYADSFFLRHASKFRVCLTIDDFLTITAIPSENSSKAIQSTPFARCGPGTLFIDYAIRYATSNKLGRDEVGAYGERGVVNENLVDRFLKLYDYSQRPIPITMAVEMFGQHEVQALIDECRFVAMSDPDIVATLTRITSESIISHYHKILAEFFPGQKVDELFICGRGAKNINIVDWLEERLPDDTITRPFDDIGIPGEAKSAVYCALLGFETALRYAQAETRLERDQAHGIDTRALMDGKKWEDIRERVTLFSDGKTLPPVQHIVVNQAL